MQNQNPILQNGAQAAVGNRLVGSGAHANQADQPMNNEEIQNHALPNPPSNVFEEQANLA